MRLADHELGARQVAQFERDGFVGPIRVLDDRAVQSLRARIEDLSQHLEEHRSRLYEIEQSFTERPGEVVCHFLGGWRIDDRLRELIALPAITVPCAQLLGVRRLRFWHDQAFLKPPRHPGVVPWHQDYSYWTRTEPANHITLNLLLDDSDVASGCVMFVPGSHRWGLLPKLPFDVGLDAILDVLSPEQRAAFRPVPVPVRAGEATIHHSHTLHGSGPNRSDRPRRALVVNYMGPDTIVADDSVPLLTGVPQLPRGALVAGEHFPIVLDRESAV